MTSTSQIRIWWTDYFKQGYDYRDVLLGREGVKMTRFTTDAWRALEDALEGNGYGTASIVSTYYPRYIGGTTSWSLHSYSGVALDIDPADNPFIRGTRWDFTRCRFTEAQVNAVLDITTVSGARVWRWGGDFGDYMHWQLDCKPEDIETGIEEAEMPQQQWHQMIDALFLGRPDMFKPPAPVGPDYWKNLDPDSAEWKDFWTAFVKAISNT